MDSHQGLAVPPPPSLKAGTVELATRFQQVLRHSQSGDAQPPRPEQRSRCSRCPHGKPEPISSSQIKETRDAGTTLLVLENAREETFHCVCGDRFGTAPPHAEILSRQLSDRVESFPLGVRDDSERVPPGSLEHTEVTSVECQHGVNLFTFGEPEERGIGQIDLLVSVPTQDRSDRRNIGRVQVGEDEVPFRDRRKHVRSEP